MAFTPANANSSDLAKISKFGRMYPVSWVARFSSDPNHMFADLAIVAARTINDVMTENIRELEAAHIAHADIKSNSLLIIR